MRRDGAVTYDTLPRTQQAQQPQPRGQARAPDETRWQVAWLRDYTLDMVSATSRARRDIDRNFRILGRTESHWRAGTTAHIAAFAQRTQAERTVGWSFGCVRATRRTSDSGSERRVERDGRRRETTAAGGRRRVLRGATNGVCQHAVGGYKAGGFNWARRALRDRSTNTLEPDVGSRRVARAAAEPRSAFHEAQTICRFHRAQEDGSGGLISSRNAAEGRNSGLEAA